MTWERPWAWWLLLAAVPLVLLHLRLHRRRRAVVSSLLPWADLGRAHSGRQGFRRVRDRTALALLLGALLAFAAAVAAPVVGSPADLPRRLVVVLDGSATMTALLAPDRRRFDEAVAAAVRAVDRKGPRDAVTVWLATRRPRVIVSPTTDGGRVRKTLLSARPTLERQGLAATLDLASLAVRAATPGPDRTDVLVFTDPVGAAALAVRDRVEETSPGVGWTRGVVVVPSGLPDEAAIVRAEPSRHDARGLDVVVAARDGSPAPRRIVVRLGGDEVASATVDLRTGVARLKLKLPERALGYPVNLALEPGDGFPENDRTRLVVPPKLELAVAVTARDGRPSPFLVDALAAMPSVVDRKATVLVHPSAPGDAFRTSDVVIAEGDAAASVPEDVPRLEFRATGGRTVERPLLWATGVHPVLDGVDLSPLRLDRAVVLLPEPDDVVLIATAAGPVALAGEREGARRVVFGFRPDASTLPLEPAFPLLVRNALRWMARPPLLPPYVVAGEPLTPTEPLLGSPGGSAPVRIWVEGPAPFRAQARVGDGGLLGIVVAEPLPGGPYGLRVLGLPTVARTVVRWREPDGFTLVAPPGSVPPKDAVPVDAAGQILPDRSDNVDSRTRLGWIAALLGAVLLLVGAVALGPSAVRIASADRKQGPVPTPG